MLCDLVNRLVWWKVRCVDRTRKEMFDRHLVLDESAGMSDSESEELVALLDSGKSSRKVLKFRKFFKEVGEPEFMRLLEESHQKGEPSDPICVGGEYFEDDAGNALDDIGVIQILSGQEIPIILGNPKSVMRIGPVSLKNKSGWTQDKTDDIGHYLQLVGEIVQSNWLREPLRLSSKGDKFELEHPGKDNTRSMILCMRQLLLKRDDVLNHACKIYLQHVGDNRKRWWVKERQDSFREARKGTSFPMFISEYSCEELIDLITYGSGSTHRKSQQKWERKLRAVVETHGREKLMFAFSSSCRQLLGYAVDIAYVVAQDFRHWIDVDGCLAPKRVSLNDLLG